jgi:mRNA interferase RelE/StbE
MHANNVRPLTGSPFSRLRAGGFRAIFSEDDRAILVLKIGPRGGVYD